MYVHVYMYINTGEESDTCIPVINGSSGFVCVCVCVTIITHFNLFCH